MITTEGTGDLHTYLTRLVPFGFSGAALLARGDEVLLNEGYGLADRRAGTPNTPDTVFSLGSITKQFTAAAVLALQARGELDVAAPIAAYLPDVPADKAGVTLHHLLTHTGGFIDYLAGDYDLLSREGALKIALEAPLRFEPGSRYEYSNAGYTLLAAIVELVSGEGYEAFLRRTFFEPLGMTSTGYRLPDWEGRTVASFHVDGVSQGSNLEKKFPSWALMGSGELLSTTLDMLRWHRGLMGEEVLPEAAERQLYRPALNDYAYGWRVTQGAHGRLAEHGGASSFGSCAYCRRYLDADVMFVLFCNQVDDGTFLPGVVKEQVSTLAFGGTVALPPAAPAVAAAELAALAGERRLSGGGRVSLAPRGDHLRVLPLDAPACDALFPGVAGREALEARSLAIVQAAARGDLGPLSASRLAGRPTEAVERLVGEFSRGRAASELVVAGTTPSRYVPGATDTYVTTTEGARSLLCVWQDGALYGCALLVGDGRDALSAPCVPERRAGGTGLLGYHAASARPLRLTLTDEAS